MNEEVPDDPFCPPECKVKVLIGRVYGHPHKQDGERIRSTAIMPSRSRGTLVVTESGRRYRLGAVEVGYREWLERVARARGLRVRPRGADRVQQAGEEESMSTPRSKPLCQAARSWLQLRRGKNCLAPLTGGTSRLFSAYLHLVDAWLSGGGMGGQEPIVAALRHVVAGLQESEWPLAAEAIAYMGDWSHIEELWAQIRPEGAPMFAYHSTTNTVLGFDAPMQRDPRHVLPKH